MVFDRREYKIPHANGDVLYKAVMKSDECPSRGEEAELVKFSMLRFIVENPDLAGAGDLRFDTLSMKHHNGCWVLEVSALKVKE